MWILREMRELQHGYCRPCRRARQCATCKDVNTNRKAQVCICCSDRRVAQGARTQQLVAWCLTCTTREARESQRCPSCYDKIKARSCNHCGEKTELHSARHRCVGRECGQEIYLCLRCKPLEFSASKMLCKTLLESERAVVHILQ